MSRNRYLAALALVLAVSRFCYARIGLTFDSAPRLFYWQLIDPALLRSAPWQSIFYLRNQPPLMNIFVAVVTRFFPDHPARAFQPIYLAMGPALAFCLFLLLDRLGVKRPQAFAIAAVCTASPVTALYENWLFYEYPIALLVCASALLLHRYAAGGRARDGSLFFTCLAMLGMFRVLYHLGWFFAIAAALVWALPKLRGRTLRCAAGPGVALLAVYAKTLLLFGILTPGADVYGNIALTTLARGTLSKYQLARLANRGVVSRLMVYDLDQVDRLTSIVPLPPRTGIPILDNPLKSTGVASMDSLWMVDVCRRLHSDGAILLRYRPEGAFETLRLNVGRYFLPADIGWPFDGRADTNAVVMKPALEVFDFLLTGTQPGHQYAWLSFVTMPLLFGFGLVSTVRALRSRRWDAESVTVAFAFGNIAWLTAVVLYLDFTDQNRIVFEVFPLYAALLGRAIRTPRLPSFSGIPRVIAGWPGAPPRS